MFRDPVAEGQMRAPIHRSIPHPDAAKGEYRPPPFEHRRLRRNDPAITDDAARHLAEHGTRPVPGGLMWKHDPLHRTMGPYPFRVDVAAGFWARIPGPVLYLDGDRSTLRLPDAEVDRRLALFRDARRATIAGAGHALMRHQPAAVAAALLDFLLS